MMHIKRIFSVVLFITLCCARLEAQQTVKFNFSRTSKPVSGWINAKGDPSDSVIVVTDATTGIGISSVATSNWAPFGQGCSADDIGTSGGAVYFFPSAVMANQWSQFSDYYAAYNGALPQFKITGLNVDSVYTLMMTGSFNLKNDFINTDPVRYSVAGTSVYGYVDVNCSYNTANGAVFHNIAPDATGTIRIWANTALGSTLASINGIQIIRERTTAPTPEVHITHPAPNQVFLQDNGDITINATATETGGSIVKVEFFIESTKIGEDSTAPYSFVWPNPDEGTYQIKARAVDGLGNTSTSTINVSVESLSSYWSMTGNINANADSVFVGTVDTNRLALRTNNLERVSILGNGNVGIGTKDTKGYKFAVNGDAIFNKVRIRTYTAWPDYVFGKEYRLPTLDSLERYIQANRHLPGIIEAGNAKEEGLDIADDQAALLRKIEELTLYLIEEHKQVEALKKEVSALRSVKKSGRKKASSH